MNKLIAVIILLVSTLSTPSFAQDAENFRAYFKTQKMVLLRAYAKKDITGYRVALGELETRYNKITDKEKEKNKWYIGEAYYLAADLYALTGDKKNALLYLKKSEYYDYDDLVSDHDLDGIRKEPEFKKLLEEAKKNSNSDYLSTLRKSPKYNTGEKTDLPAFTYQSADDPHLKSLKATYNLDSIAGKGNDVSRIINLMKWVHYLIPHDGSKGNPDTKNALSLITECRRDHKTLNCRGLAIVLNEVYLAEGFKSRFVTCLPLDTTDQDCHVITMVWAPSLKKWVWMDPTFMAYVMNEKGELLGIEEVRDRLVNNKPIILNPDANRNHAASQTKDDYLEYYMAKNLYKLECAVDSRYNYETREEGKARAYVQLLPGTKPAPVSAKDKHGVASYKLYYTNNPGTFWAAPEQEPAAKQTVAALQPADYEQAMGRFRIFYNGQQADSVACLFPNPEEMKGFLGKDALQELMNGYGKMISYKYMGMESAKSDVALFKMVFEKSTHAMGISLDGNHKMGTFRFETSSSSIDKMLAKEL